MNFAFLYYSYLIRRGGFPSDRSIPFGADGQDHIFPKDYRILSEMMVMEEARREPIRKISNPLRFFSETEKHNYNV